MTELGSSIVAPINDENQSNVIRQALKTNILGKIIDYYNNKQIPRIELFKNTLKKEFHVDPNDVDLCYDVFMANAKEYNLIQEIKWKRYLKFDDVSVKPQSPEEKFESLEQLEKEEPKINDDVKDRQRVSRKKEKIFRYDLVSAFLMALYVQPVEA